MAVDELPGAVQSDGVPRVIDGAGGGEGKAGAVVDALRPAAEGDAGEAGVTDRRTQKWLNLKAS